MGSITATCQHEITSEWHTSDRGLIRTKRETREGRRAICYQIVCPECLRWYEGEGLILKTEEEEDTWMTDNVISWSDIHPYMTDEELEEHVRVLCIPYEDDPAEGPQPPYIYRPL